MVAFMNEPHKLLPCGAHALIEAQRQNEFLWLIGLLAAALLFAISLVVWKRLRPTIWV
jgi:hypothetical protein